MLRIWLVVLLVAVLTVPWILAFRWIKNRPDSEERHIETLAFAVLAGPVYLVTVLLIALQFLSNTALAIVRAIVRFWFEQVLQEQYTPPGT
jgi:hypothetical protein